MSTASWFCWQDTGDCLVQLLMAQVGLSRLAADWRAVFRVYCNLVLLAEHWRLFGAAADDSGWPEWTGWLLEGSSEGLLQAGSAGRTLEAVGCSC